MSSKNEPDGTSQGSSPAGEGWRRYLASPTGVVAIVGVLIALASALIALVAFLGDRGALDPPLPPTPAPSPAPVATCAPSPVPQLRSFSPSGGGRDPALVVPRPAGVCVGDLMIAQVAVRGREEVQPAPGWVVIQSTTVDDERMATFSKVADIRDTDPTGAPYSFPTADSIEGEYNGEAGGITIWSGVETAAKPVVVLRSSPPPGPRAEVGGVDVTSPGSIVLLMFSPILPAGVTSPPSSTPIWDVQTPETPGARLYRASASAAYFSSAGGQTGPLTVQIETDDPLPWIAQVIVLAPARR